MSFIAFGDNIGFGATILKLADCSADSIGGAITIKALDRDNATHYNEHCSC